MSNKIGMVTIGQSPRVDLLPKMSDILGSDFQVIEKGALDGLSYKEIEKMKPSLDEDLLVTRLKDGSFTTIGKKGISYKIQENIDELEIQDVELIVLLCTDEFPTLSSNTLLIQPAVILGNILCSVFSEKNIGVLVPLKEQIPQMLRKWKKYGLNVIIDSAIPNQQEKEVRTVAQRLLMKEIELLVLDCISYNTQMKKIVSEETKKPVIRPYSLIINIVKDLLV